MENVTDASFKRLVTDSKVPVLLDIWDSEGDGFNNDVAILKVIAKEYSSILKVARMNTRNGPLTLEELEIRGIPMLLLFRGGERIASLSQRAQDPETIQEFIVQNS